MNSKLKIKQDKIVAGLVETRRALLAAASSLTPKDQDEVFLGIWSVKDLLAHLVGWDITYLDAIKEMLDGRLPTFFSLYDRDWKTYNAGLVAKYKKEDFGELLASIEASHHGLIDYLKSIPAEEFDRDRGVRSGSTPMTIAWLLKFEIRDEKRHCQQILEFKEKREAEKK